MYKLILTVISIVLSFGISIGQNVSISDDPTYLAEQSAILDVKSHSKGLLAPRMSTADRLAIVDPADALIVYDTEVPGYFYFNSLGWQMFSDSRGWQMTGDTVLYYQGNIGIGTSLPMAKLHIEESRVNIPSFGCTNGNKSLFFCNNLDVAGFNPIVHEGDMGLFFGNNTAAGNQFVIAPWSGSSCGLRFTDSTINITGVIAHSYGGIHPDNIPFQDEVSYQIGTAGAYSNNIGSNWGNNFQIASWVQSSGTKPSVAVFGEGEGTGQSSKVWGGNFVAYANYNSGTQGENSTTAIGTEINFGSLQSGGLAYGLVIASAGYNVTENYIQVQSNTDASIPKNGIVFGGWSRSPVSGSLITTGGGYCAAQNGIDFSQIIFTGNAFMSPGFQVYSNGWVSALGLTQTSDLSAKQSIQPIKNALNIVLKMQGVSYYFKDSHGINHEFTSAKQVGFIAQNVERVLPEVVFTGKNGKKSMAYQNITAVLVEAIKEQQIMIVRMENEIEILKTKIENK